MNKKTIFSLKFIVIISIIFFIFIFFLSYLFKLQVQVQQQSLPLITESNTQDILNNKFNNPFYPPLKEPDYIPVNIKTQSYDNDIYIQIGFLTKNKEILPLFGKRTYKDKYNYYTTTSIPVVSQIKLPIFVNGKDCMQENGVNELYDKDVVTVQNEEYVVTIYQNKLNRYI
jgi:hypothetical protein